MIHYGTVIVLLSYLLTGSKASMEEQPDERDTEWGRIGAFPSKTISQPKTGLLSNDEGHIQQADEDVDVAIIGGGLAGLLVAIGINSHCNNNDDDDDKLKCKIYERAPKLRSVSQGILSVHPNGMYALQQVHPDLPTMVRNVGCQRLMSMLTKIDADGNVVKVEKHDISSQKKCAITWHKMQQTLASLLPSNDDNGNDNVVETSRSLTHYVEDDETDTVLLFFDDGSTVRARIVLGCDGVFSQVRRQMAISNNDEGDDYDDRPVFFGQLNWGSIFPTKNLPLHIQTSSVHSEGEIHAISYDGDPRWLGYLSDAGSGYTFFQLRVTDPEKAMALSGSEGRGGLGLPGVKDALLPIAKVSEAISAVLECIPESQIFERSIVGRLPAKLWVSPGGRVALVGDAAHGMHPTIAAGGNSSFESALAVVRALAEVRKRKLPLKQSLVPYEKERKPRADIVQQFANMMGCAQATGEKLMEMDKMMAMLEWIQDNPTGSERGGEKPPPGVMKALHAFDPLTQKGVSLV